MAGFAYVALQHRKAGQGGGGPLVSVPWLPNTASDRLFVDSSTERLVFVKAAGEDVVAFTLSVLNDPTPLSMGCSRRILPSARPAATPLPSRPSCRDPPPPPSSL